MTLARVLHDQAMRIAKKYLAAENELLEVIQKIFETRSFAELGYRSLHEYCVLALKLTDGQAYAFTSVLKKSREVPALKEAVQKGELSLNTARKIVSVITPDNQQNWIEKAKTLRQKDLEKEIVKSHPEIKVRSAIKPVTETKRELRVLIDKELESRIERIRELESQRTKKAATLEDVLVAMAKLFIEKNDPIEKAKRVETRSRAVANGPASLKETHPPFFSARRKIPEATLRKVRLRDRGQCQSKKCEERKWLEVHHLKPVSLGGGHELDNLLTLCSFHHRRVHTEGNLLALTPD